MVEVRLRDVLMMMMMCSRFWVLGSGPRVEGSGFRGQGLGFRPDDDAHASLEQHSNPELSDSRPPC